VGFSRGSLMPKKDLNAAEALLQEFGLDLARVLRDTHAETMLRLGTTIEDCLEIAIKADAIVKGPPIEDKAFRRRGRLENFKAKVKEAGDRGIIHGAMLADADLIREIRNEFGHMRSKVHFDSPDVVKWAVQLSTYRAADSNQDAIFVATADVMDQIRASVPRRSASERVRYADGVRACSPRTLVPRQQGES
jgi:hypothetical protein